MQATLNLPPSPPLPLIIAPTKSVALPWNPLITTTKLQTTTFRRLQLKPTAAANDAATVDYSSITSVFPAEACETIGGEACDVEMYPEVKLSPEPSNTAAATTALEPVDRDYLQYDDPKTVFPGEACDDLGGEFCEPEYQTGVY
ncbi:Light regulated Lir [Parasponia andersonii]|uniref:Light regulated Lir n=1 Tax=Parasponia andersonii TaxID=3476 RepID=A0A2P5C1B3_PARAD|nr:Light regulated Lir [Parasponia andersonii]